MPHMGPESRTGAPKRKLKGHFPPIRAMERRSKWPLKNGLPLLGAQRLLSRGAADLLQGARLRNNRLCGNSLVV